MKVYVGVKDISSRKSSVREEEFELNDGIRTAGELRRELR